MAIRTVAALAAAALSLAACQRPDVWDSPPGGDQAQFHRDNLDCQVTARGAVGDSFVMGPPLFVALASAAHQENVRGAYRECMMGKSYSLETK